MSRKCILLIFILTVLNTLTAFGNINVYIDGQTIPNSQVYVVDDMVYMSLRELSEYSNYKIDYDTETSTVNFYDSKPTNVSVDADSIVDNSYKNYLFPVNISSVINDEKSRSIIKIYELTGIENPADINKNSFNQGGFTYSLSDITKTGNVTTDNKEHVEKTTIDTATNNINTILNELEKTKEITTEDGFVGTLHLDISSIKSEVKGYKNSNYTVTEVREYPNLSAPDTSLIPKSVSIDGKQFNVSNITWNNADGTRVDDVFAPQSYTATATYTAQATKSTLLGYTTTAEYKGIVSKVIDGKVIYTAYFDGIPTETHYKNIETENNLFADSLSEIDEVGIVEEEIINLPIETIYKDNFFNEEKPENKLFKISFFDILPYIIILILLFLVKDKLKTEFALKKNLRKLEQQMCEETTEYDREEFLSQFTKNCNKSEEEFLNEKKRE